MAVSRQLNPRLTLVHLSLSSPIPPIFSRGLLTMDRMDELLPLLSALATVHRVSIFFRYLLLYNLKKPEPIFTFLARNILIILASNLAIT